MSHSLTSNLTFLADLANDSRLRTVERDVKPSHGAVVCEDTLLIGQIHIGTKTIIHPKASILALAGPITIGQGNIIEENVIIINSKYKNGMTIENFNVVEVGCRVEDSHIGSYNTLECGSQVRACLGRNCIVGPKCVVEKQPSDKLLNNTVITATTSREQPDVPTSHLNQVECLAKQLPEHNKIIRTIPRQT